MRHIHEINSELNALDDRRQELMEELKAVKHEQIKAKYGIEIGDLVEVKLTVADWCLSGSAPERVDTYKGEVCSIGHWCGRWRIRDGFAIKLCKKYGKMGVFVERGFDDGPDLEVRKLEAKA